MSKHDTDNDGQFGHAMGNLKPSPATYREAFTREEALAFAELWKDAPTHSPNPGGLFGKLARYILASVPSETPDSGALADLLMDSLKEAGHVIGLATALHVVNAMRFRTIPSHVVRTPAEIGKAISDKLLESDTHAQQRELEQARKDGEQAAHEAFGNFGELLRASAPSTTPHKTDDPSPFGLVLRLRQEAEGSTIRDLLREAARMIERRIVAAPVSATPLFALDSQIEIANGERASKEKAEAQVRALLLSMRGLVDLLDALYGIGAREYTVYRDARAHLNRADGGKQA